MISCGDRFSIIPKKVGRYCSFPTLAKLNDKILLAFRSAAIDKNEPHGKDGHVELYQASLSDINNWQQLSVSFLNEQRWELDSIISIIDQTLYFQTRHFKSNEYNESYYSRLPLEEFDGNHLTLSRSSLSKLTPVISASYGHMQRAHDNALLLTGYGGLSETRITSPFLYQSNDDGATWTLRSILANSDVVEKYLNEYSMVSWGEQGWLVLIRDDNEPSILWQAVSEDDGHSWSELRDSGLRGHAPMLCKCSQGVVAIYRDLSGEMPSISLAILRDDNAWETLDATRSYTGGAYNGGYGDVLDLGDNRLLATYYVSDENESPWIEGLILEL